MAANSCDDGWMFDGDQSCFKLLDQKKTQPEAQAACVSVGATLGVPTNSFVADIMVCDKALTLFGVKLNLFSLQLRGVADWVWTGVTTEDHEMWSSNYHDWFGDEPNNEQGNGNDPPQ